jgi:REP element-mobilizing transposase RayT
MEQPWPIQLFDPDQDFHVLEQRRLPHWSQAGTMAFITWRTCDSIAAAVFARWQVEDDAWLRRHRVDPQAPDGLTQLRRVKASLPERFLRFRRSRWHAHLDTLQGECVLRRRELNRIVAEALEHFDERRYRLTDYVVMPNHIHLLAAFPDGESMVAQCCRWKRYTATRINRCLDRHGRFWQSDSFDHLVRTIDQFNYLRLYIARNPVRARLEKGEYAHFSKRL